MTRTIDLGSASDQLAEHVMSILSRVGDAFVSPGWPFTDTSVTRSIDTRAELIVAELASGDPHLAAEAARMVVSTVWADDAAIPDEWYGTPLGAFCLLAGHERMLQEQAALVLGVRRQRVGQLVSQGKLDRHPDGGVTTVSVRARLDIGRRDSASG